MLRKGLFLGIFFLSLSLSPKNLNSTTVVFLTDKDLTKMADQILTGKCISKESFWTSDGKRIYTIYKILVNKRLKGKTSQQIFVFRQWGGTKDGFTYYIPGLATFEPSEEAFGFFTPPNSKGFRYTVGLAQGKLKILRNRKKKLLMRNTVGLHFRGRKHFRGKIELYEYNEYESKIKSYLEELKRKK
ncbi:MAG: hypothetical protein D6785_13135 [Planctomycetota bacterium]|nr:MAG: hypothetical protein D6785_13135 [Planctomycetota bacterium]